MDIVVKKNIAVIVFLLIAVAVLSLFSNSDADAERTVMVDPSIDDTPPFCYLSKPCSQLTMIASNKAAQLTFDGAIYTGAVEFCMFYGKLMKPVMARQKALLDGWIPVVSYSWEDGEILYNAETFAYSPDGDPQGNLIYFVKVEIYNSGKNKEEVYFSAGTRFCGKDHRFEHMKPYPFNPKWTYEMTPTYLLRDNKAILFYPKNGVKEAVPGDPYSAPFSGADKFITDRAEVGIIKYDKALLPAEKMTLVFKIPSEPVPADDLAQIKSIQNLSYSSYKNKTVKFWRNELSKGVKLSIPEEKVMNVHRSSLMYTWQAIWQKDGKWIQGVNKFQYRGFWLRDGAYIIHANDVWGHQDIARKTLEIYPNYQKPDGLFSSYDGQFDGFGQGLFALGEHALITGDMKYAREIYKHFPPAVEWLKKARASDQFNIMPTTDVTDNEFITGHYTGHNFWALLGIRTAIRIAKMNGNIEDAANYQREYDSLYAAFMKKLEEVSGKDGYIPPGLDVKGGQDWGNLIGVYPSEVLDPHDPRLSTTLAKMHDEKYKEGVMTYMGRLHQYLTVKSSQNHIFRGEQEQALKDFYSILLHTGSTNEMFEWQAAVWGDRDVDGNFPPHGWGAAMLNLMLRNMLVYESGGNGGIDYRDIHLFSVVSPNWVKTGEEISFENAPTEIGQISAKMEFTKQGANIKIKNKFRVKPKTIVIHIPYFVDFTSYEANVEAIACESDKIVFPPDVKRIRLYWTVKQSEPLSFENTVTNYKKEYKERFEEYIKNGGKPVDINAPKILENEERVNYYNAIYGTQEVGIAIGKPVKASGKIEFDHKPEFAVDGNSSDPEGSSWWVGPPSPQQLTIDLEKIRKVCAVHVFPYWDGSRYYQYTIELSVDGDKWINAADMSNNTTPSSPIGDYHKINPSKDARYIRIIMLHNSANTSMHLVELKVFAEDKE